MGGNFAHGCCHLVDGWWLSYSPLNEACYEGWLVDKVPRWIHETHDKKRRWWNAKEEIFPPVLFRRTKSGSRSFTTAETGNRFRFHNVLKIYFLFILSCNFPICFPFSLEFSERWAELGCWCEGVFLVRIGMEFWVICDKCLIYFIFLTYCGFYLLNLEFCFWIFDLFLCELT